MAQIGRSPNPGCTSCLDPPSTMSAEILELWHQLAHYHRRETSMSADTTVSRIAGPYSRNKLGVRNWRTSSSGRKYIYWAATLIPADSAIMVTGRRLMKLSILMDEFFSGIAKVWLSDTSDDSFTLYIVWSDCKFIHPFTLSFPPSSFVL